MDKRLRRTLILDTDPDTLITLQHVLEDGGIDATITWDEAEACHLLADAPFDLILIGDHPPELNAAAVINYLGFRGMCPPVVILKGITSKKDVEDFYRLGAAGVVSKRDHLAVIEQVRNTLALTEFRADSAMVA